MSTALGMCGSGKNTTVSYRVVVDPHDGNVVGCLIIKDGSNTYEIGTLDPWLMECLSRAALLAFIDMQTPEDTKGPVSIPLGPRPTATQLVRTVRCNKCGTLQQLPRGKTMPGCRACGSHDAREVRTHENN